MSEYDDDEEMFDEYQRYVRATTGIPEDYDTWVLMQTQGQRKKPKKQRPKKFTDFSD
jgi:hypothetical protein